MAKSEPRTGLELRSLITREGLLELSLERVAIPEPAAHEIVVRDRGEPDQSLGSRAAARARPIRRAPPAAAAGGQRRDGPDRARAATRLPGPPRSIAAGRQRRRGRGRRSGRIARGPGAARSHGRPRRRRDRTRSVASSPPPPFSPSPPGTLPAEAASWFVNPLTALGMVETMRREGHTALVHTAAASNLGQMLQKICLADGIALVNIVRRPEQEAMLRGIGAKLVCNSGDRGFPGEARRRAGRERCHPRLRRDRRRRPRRPDPLCDGGCAAAQGDGLQPLRLDDPQAGLSLRPSRPHPDRPRQRRRDGLGDRRLAAAALPAEGLAPRRTRVCGPGSWQKSAPPSRAITAHRSRWPKRSSSTRSGPTRARRPARNTSSIPRNPSLKKSRPTNGTACSCPIIPFGTTSACSTASSISIRGSGSNGCATTRRPTGIPLPTVDSGASRATTTS